jgi:hypothetical protein
VQSEESSQVAEVPIGFELVHAVQGRVRLRVLPPHDVDDLARAIEAVVGDWVGVQEIRRNPDCQSVVLTYDPDVLREAGVITLTSEATAGNESWIARRLADLEAAARALTERLGETAGWLVGKLPVALPRLWITSSWIPWPGHRGAP